MSADNGIYILRTRRAPIKRGNTYENQHGKFEYRVAHCSAIDNIDYSDLYLPLYFGNSKVFHSPDEAFAEAQRKVSEIENGGWFTEYGICNLNKDCYFPNMTAETARKALDCYEGAIPV